MRDPERLLDAASPFEADLLRSWRNEQPSAAARARALAIGATLPATPSGAAGHPVATTVARKGLSTAAKWALLGGAGAGSIVAALVLQRPGEKPVPVAPASHAVATVVAPIETQIQAPVAPQVEVPQSSVVNPTGAPAATHPPSKQTASSLAEEVSRIDQARAALQANDAQLAEGRIEAYRARFPEGALFEEAEAVRIEALAMRGDTSGAASALDRFVARFPKSPHKARLQKLCSSGTR